MYRTNVQSHEKPVRAADAGWRHADGGRSNNPQKRISVRIDEGRRESGVHFPTNSGASAVNAINR
jgi:hypothetical protein